MNTWLKQILALALIMMVFVANGASNDEQWDEWEEEEAPSPFTFNSYAQVTLGHWLQPSQVSSQAVSPESSGSDWSRKLITWRLEADYEQSFYQLSFKSDLGYDLVDSSTYEKVRELSLKTDFSNLDSDHPLLNNEVIRNTALSVGRQSLSWGVGDFIFINDLFAKNWKSFFNGDDEQYLKQPNDAIRLSYFASTLNLDVIYQPRSNTDGLINTPKLKAPNGDAINARVYFSHQQRDYAMYASNGWTTSPAYFDGKFQYLRRKSLGASMVSPLSGGLFKLEVGNYWLSANNTNSQQQFRWLIAYEQELRARLTLALQLYQERDTEHSQFDDRQMLTSQLSYQSKDSNWNSRLMVFYSPNHHDHYIRATSSYRHNDNITLTFGLNTMAGKEHSFFGSLSRQDNAYLRFTYYF